MPCSPPHPHFPQTTVYSPPPRHPIFSLPGLCLKRRLSTDSHSPLQGKQQQHFAKSHPKEGPRVYARSPPFMLPRGPSAPAWPGVPAAVGAQQAGRRGRAAPKPARNLGRPFPPSSHAPRQRLRLSGSQGHLGEKGRGRRGGRRWGRSSKVQLFARVPPAAWPRALCKAALAAGTGHARGGGAYTKQAQNRCFPFSAASSPQRPPQSALA